MTSAQQISQEEHFRNEQKSGLFGGGGFGFTIGKKSEKTDTKDHILNEIESTVGSTTGSVSITAGNEVNSAGTTFITGKDLNITGKEVTIDNTLDIYDSQTTYEFKQTGLSVSLGGGAVTGISNTVANIERSGEVKDERLKALYEYKALQDIKKLGASKGDVSKDVSVSVSIGSTKMTSDQTSQKIDMGTEVLSCKWML